MRVIVVALRRIEAHPFSIELTDVLGHHHLALVHYPTMFLLVTAGQVKEARTNLILFSNSSKWVGKLL